MKPDMTEKLIAYLEGELSATETQQVEAEVAKSEALRQELQELEQLFQTMESVPVERPSAQLNQRFYRFLEQEKAAQSESKAKVFTLRRPEWLAVAAVIILAIGIGFGVLWQNNMRQQQQINSLVAEVETTRKMMILSMLQEQSASKRIQAVNTAVEQRAADPQVLDALIFTLQTDDNVNVRLKAAEALAEFANEQKVINALTNALRTEDSPEVQIALIDVLTNLRAPEALDEFKTLMEKEELLDVVKNKAARGVEVLL
jgi:hypothetical protein